MLFSALMLLLALAAAVHNLEEWQGYDEWAALYHARLPAQLKDRSVFRFAFILLTVSILAVAALHCITGGMMALCRLIVFALLLNALGHCVLSLYKRRFVPGTVSALFLILPLSGAAIYEMRPAFVEAPASLLLSIAGSAVLIPAAVYASLWIGLGAKRIYRFSARNHRA